METSTDFLQVLEKLFISLLVALVKFYTTTNSIQARFKECLNDFLKDFIGSFGRERRALYYC